MTNFFLTRQFVDAMRREQWQMTDYRWPLVPDDHIIVFMPPPNDDWAVCLLSSQHEGFARGVLLLPSKRQLAFRADDSGFYSVRGKAVIADKNCRSTIGTAIAAICKISAGRAGYSQKLPFSMLAASNNATKQIKALQAHIGDEKPSDEYRIIQLGRSNDYVPDSSEECRETGVRQRYHQRRGHWRSYANGKRVWVKACWAGDRALGIVHKDYVVKQQQEERDDG